MADSISVVKPEQASEDTAPLQLLGYNLPLNLPSDRLKWNQFSKHRRDPFPNALHWGATPITLRERAMIAFMCQITEKPDWERKVRDEDITKKWQTERAELEKQIEANGDDHGFSEAMFEYCIAELQDYAKFSERRNFVPAVDATATVYKSDNIVPDNLKMALRQATIPLEDVPASKQDWHPGSDGKVLDLVHPALYPLLYGRSRILLDDFVPLSQCAQYTGKGEILPLPKPEELHDGQRVREEVMYWRLHPKVVYSSRFQWLPCEVDFDEDGTVKIASYVNNLHPVKHRDLYPVIEQIVAKAIPLWNATLSSTMNSIMRLFKPARIEVSYPEYINTELPPHLENKPPMHSSSPSGVSEEEIDLEAVSDEEMDPEDLDEARDEWIREHRVLVQPEPRPYTKRAHHGEAEDPTTMFFPKDVDLRRDFGDDGLQVIVKLANIHLTPEKSSYDGGSWHIEGSLNEHICATALYYYDCENITDSYLAFREAMSTYKLEDMPYEQSEYEHFEKLYNIEQNGPGIQELGRVLTKEGRLLVFPNVLQHRVQSFRLADPTRPGHRKILALFLVDPHTRIPSTANIPPQQQDWWREMALSLDRVADLPPELAEHVLDSAGDFPISLDEAKKLRLELMEERKGFVEEVDKKMHEATFNFCEH